jgi:hypothetical protein
LIVDGARAELEAVDWTTMGVRPDMMFEHYELLAGVELRQSAFISPLHLLAGHMARDVATLKRLPAHRVQQAKPGYFWALVMPPEIMVEPEHATATKDYIHAKMLEHAAIMDGKNPANALFRIASAGPSQTVRAGLRFMRFHALRPELFRPIV